MGKISYSNMKLKIKKDIKEIEYNGNTIEVSQYLPIEDKYDLIMATLQKSEEVGYYNALKLDMYFHLHLVYLYTNISFTEKQKEDELKLYDSLKSNGLIDEIVKDIPDAEYNDLLYFMDKIIEDSFAYKTSVAGLANSIITDLPKQAEAAMKIVDQFDPNKFQAVKDFAKAANGGRDI